MAELFPTRPLHLEQVLLQHVRYAIHREIPLGAAAIDSMEVYQRAADMTRGMVIALATDIQSQHLATKTVSDTKTFEFVTPDGWFSHLRHDLSDYQCRKAFSNCPVVRWYAQVLRLILWVLGTPVYKTEKKTVTTYAEVSIDALFPESDIVVLKDDRLGKPIIVNRIVRQETDIS